MAHMSRVKFITHRSKPLTKIIASTAIVLAILALAALHLCKHNIDAKTEAMREQAAALQQENAALEQKIDAIDTVEGIHDVAQEELGLVDPDAVIIETD